MKTTTLTTTRAISVILVILLFSLLVNAQIKIRERVDIKPKVQTLAKTSSSSNGFTGFFDKISFTPDAPYTNVYFVRPSIVTVSCNFICNELVPPVGVWASDSAITNRSTTINVYCECERCEKSFPVYIWNYTDSPMIIDNVSATTGPYVANILFQGHMVFPKGPSLFTAEVTLSAVPLNEPVFEMPGHYPDALDATESAGPVSASFSAYTRDDWGGFFIMCARSVPMKFTLETPMHGVRLEGRDLNFNIIQDSISIEVPYTEGASADLVWDGNRLPFSDDTILTVSASRFDLSDAQKIKLIKIIPHHFDIVPEAGTVVATESVPIRVIAKSIDNQEEPFDGAKKVTLSAPYGGSFIIDSDTLNDEATVTYQVARSGTIKYLDSYGIPWTGTEPYEAPLAVWRTDHPERISNGVVNVLPLCFVVNVSAKNIGKGDSVQIDFMMKNPNTNSLIPFEASQYFAVWMNTDEMYGKLRCTSTGESGRYLIGHQPFEFIAADSIADSTVVEIQARTSYGGGGGGASSIIGPGMKDTLHLPVGSKMELQPSKSKLGITASTRAAVMETNTIRSLVKLKKRLIAIREKAKNKSQFDKIIADIESEYSGTNGVTKKTDNASNMLAKAGQKALNAEGGEYCSLPVADVTIKGPELVVDSLKGEDNNQFIAGTDLPKMPKPLITAQLENFNGGAVEFNWTLTIKWKAKGINFSTPLDKTEKYTGTASGQNSEIVDLEIGETLYGETDMRGGDDITLTVICTTKVDNKEYTKVTKNPFVIKGQNPTFGVALAELGGDQYAAIAAHESNFNQFHTPGSASLHGESYDHPQIVQNPFQGDDRTDIGMMQINSPWNYPNNWYYNNNDYDCDDIIWNWVTNVQQGKLFFRYLFETTTSYHLVYPEPSGTAKDEPLDEEERYCESYCEYNGGPGAWYWDWEPGDPEHGKSGSWIRSIDVAGSRHRDYADDVDNLRVNHSWR